MAPHRRGLGPVQFAGSAPVDLVDPAVGQRNHQQVAVGCRADIRDDAETGTEQQRLAFGHVERIAKSAQDFREAQGFE